MKAHRSRQKRSSVSVLEMNNAQAAAFFLKDESYCTFDLPPYFAFKSVLKETDRLLRNKPIPSLQHFDPREADGVNHIILTNKDGKFAWRPMQLIHPALYVSLVRKITEVGSWQKLKKRFTLFSRNPKIHCLSIPAESKGKDAAGQVSKWWQEIEQKSIELSLDFEYIAHADITDCYGSIYTHSIAWAIHGQKLAKRHRQSGKLGNDIDRNLQGMNFGQTNGIPQGSALMNFIAEIVLGYSDLILSLKLKKHGISDYRILRFRDDYRIFVNQPKDGEIILKCLSETMHGLGMQLHPSKTGLTREVIRQSIKPDKLAWMCRKQTEKDIQKHLLVVYAFSQEHPNTGSLLRGLQEIYKRLRKKGAQIANPLPLIGIIVDIALHNPRVYPVAAGILSILIGHVPKSERPSVFLKLKERLQRIPNSGYLEIWLQRISRANGIKAEYVEPLCKLIDDPKKVQYIWNIDWLSSKDLIISLRADKIVRRRTLDKIPPVIPSKEFELFPIYPG